MEHDDSIHHASSGSPDTPEMVPPNPIPGIPPPDSTAVLPSENTNVGEQGGTEGWYSPTEEEPPADHQETSNINSPAGILPPRNEPSTQGPTGNRNGPSSIHEQYQRTFNMRPSVRDSTGSGGPMDTQTFQNLVGTLSPTGAPPRSSTLRTSLVHTRGGTQVQTPVRFGNTEYRDLSEFSNISVGPNMRQLQSIPQGVQIQPPSLDEWLAMQNRLREMETLLAHCTIPPVVPENRERALGRGSSLSSFGGERAGTRAKLASPHVFDGSYTEEYNVLNWFLAVERYLYNCDVSDQLFSSYAYTYLARVVQAWFDNHFNSQPTPPWHMTVTAMKSRYLPTDHETRLLRRFTGIKQQRTLQEYVDHFQILVSAMQLAGIFRSDTEMVRQFIDGLRNYDDSINMLVRKLENLEQCYEMAR